MIILRAAWNAVKSHGLRTFVNEISHARTRESSEAQSEISATLADGALTRSVSRMQNYDNLGTIGEGTFGVVAKCRHRPTGANVAVKMFKDFDKQARNNFCTKAYQNLGNQPGWQLSMRARG